MEKWLTSLGPNNIMWALDLDNKAKLECMLLIFVAKFHIIDLKLNFLYVNHDYMKIMSTVMVSAWLMKLNPSWLQKDNI